LAGATVNGISCAGGVLFYAPLEQGPPVLGSLGNTLYYGTTRLYRSTDEGLNHTSVSQALATISAIGISPQNDNVRLVGTSSGQIFGTTTGANPLSDMDTGFVIPANYIGRAVIDPLDANTAYITLCAFGVTNVWKTTTLSSLAETGMAPVWMAANTGLPAVPVNAFVVDPLDSNRLYAGTDIGVYISHDGGANWVPLGFGLPKVAVFDIAITPPPTGTRKVRIATHGRGLWETEAVVPTAATVSVAGRVTNSAGFGVSRATVSIVDSQGVSRSALTNPFGYYKFDEVGVGQNYIFQVSSKRYQFDPQVIFVTEELENVNFTASGSSGKTMIPASAIKKK
jgi:hypothetical protein